MSFLVSKFHTQGLGRMHHILSKLDNMTDFHIKTGIFNRTFYFIFVTLSVAER